VMRATLLSTALGLLAGPALAQDLTIGTVPGAFGDSAAVAAEEAAREGLEVRLVEFSDWTTPNVALDAGDIDANFFQNPVFMANAEAEGGWDFEFVYPGILGNIGLYSLRHDSFDQIPEGGAVAVASDPVNQGRGLLLLQRAGLITLREGVGYLGTLDDITDNPRDLQFTEVEGPQLVRVTGDVDLAQGYPYFIVAAGAFDPASGLIYTGPEDLQFNVGFVTRADRADNPQLKRFVEIFQSSQAVREQIHRSYGESDDLYILAWEHL